MNRLRKYLVTVNRVSEGIGDSEDGAVESKSEELHFGDAKCGTSTMIVEQWSIQKHIDLNSNS